jgi:hypothetical protein
MDQPNWDAERARCETRDALRGRVVRIVECKTVNDANDLLRLGNHIILAVLFEFDSGDHWVKPTFVIGMLSEDAPKQTFDGR